MFSILPEARRGSAHSIPASVGAGWLGPCLDSSHLADTSDHGVYLSFLIFVYGGGVKLIIARSCLSSRVG